MITVITPTGDRPLAFELCQKWMANQFIKPDQWIVIDDGEMPVDIKYTPEYFNYIRRESSNGNSLSENLLEGIKHIIGDKIIIIEDDDYYAPDYIDFMSNQLDNYDLVGFEQARYYHLSEQKYYRFNKQKNYSSLCQTAFRENVIKEFIEILQTNKTLLDINFWRKSRQNKYLFDDNYNILQVGIKGLPGRNGIGVGHKKEFHKYFKDTNYEILKEWIPIDFGVYIDIENRLKNNKLV